MTNIDEESEESGEEEVLHEEVDQEGVPAVGGVNLMGPLLSPGQSLVLTQRGKLYSQEERSPKVKMDLEKLMRENKRWTCTSCCKSIFHKEEADKR